MYTIKMVGGDCNVNYELYHNGVMIANFLNREWAMRAARALTEMYGKWEDK